jgi:hypothetical protein
MQDGHTEQIKVFLGLVSPIVVVMFTLGGLLGQASKLLLPMHENLNWRATKACYARPAYPNHRPTIQSWGRFITPEVLTF